MSEMDAQTCPYDPFCLVLCDWTDGPGQLTATPHPNNPPNLAPPSPAPTIAQAAGSHTLDFNEVAIGLPPSHECFSSFVDDEKLAVLSKGMIPTNTDKSTKWALSNFDAWKDARNKRYLADMVPDDLYMCNDPAILSLHLSRFALETRKVNGEPYPPKTIHQLLCGLLRYMRDISPGCPNVLDKKDSRFKNFHVTLDSHYHNLHASGLGREVKHARVLSEDDEEKLWKSGVLGTSSPQALQNAVFYTVGKVFSLCGGVEMRSLCISQIKRFRQPDRYVYTENVSKTNNGTFKKLHVSNKVVPVFSCPQVGERCAIYLLDLYLSKLPNEAFEQDVFYVRPLQNIPPDPANHGTPPYQWERTPLKGSLPSFVIVLVFRGQSQTTAYNQHPLLTCIGVEYQRRSYRREPATDL